MIIKSLKFHNFKIFSDFKVDFSSITFIKGDNGVGKSTLGKEGHLFCIYGYTDKKLPELPNKINKSKSCWVEEEIEQGEDLYRIKRSYPTRLEIWKNEEQVNFATNAEAQNYLKQIFGDVHTFKKFRMVDKTIGINFLEEGQIALKKTIFSLSQEKFNIVRDKLNQIKHEREIYNKDNAIVESHYPSEKRLNIIKNELTKLAPTYDKLLQESRQLGNELNEYNRKQGQIETNKNRAKWQRDKLLQDEKCYECKQFLPKPNKQEMLKEKGEEIEKLNQQYKHNLDVIEELKEMLAQSETALEKITPKRDKLHDLKSKLEIRIKQKAYKYSNRDVEIVKRAIKELDNLSSRCLVRSISVLEPIINSVLEKINFKLTFEVNDKGKFAITLQKDDIKYDYSLLSDGQKLVLQVAFKLAMLLERNDEGVVIADEGLSSLDKENLLHILTIFEHYPYQLIFMLHNFDNIPEEIKVIALGK